MRGREIGRTEEELGYVEGMEVFFEKANGTLTDKLANFPRFTSRQTLAIFLYKYELFKRVLDVHGSVLEFGVFRGGGAFSFAQFSAILEPYNYQRRIIGFDTFEGFPAVSEEDAIHGSETGPKQGDFYICEGFDEELAENVTLFDRNRFLNHVEKLSFVKGDINETLPRFLEENRHLVVSLAYFDLDIHEPTKKADFAQDPERRHHRFRRTQQPPVAGGDGGVRHDTGHQQLPAAKASLRAMPILLRH